MVGIKIFYNKHKYELFYLIFIILILCAYFSGIHQGEYKGMKIICGSSDIVYSEIDNRYFCGSQAKYDVNPRYMYNIENIDFSNMKLIN